MMVFPLLPSPFSHRPSPSPQTAFGLSTANLLEKDDMLDSICRSGRVILTSGGKGSEDSPSAAETSASLYSFSSTALLGEEAGAAPPICPTTAFNHPRSSPQPSTHSSRTFTSSATFTSQQTHSHTQQSADSTFQSSHSSSSRSSTRNHRSSSCAVS
jgi:hypothetical protein